MLKVLTDVNKNRAIAESKIITFNISQENTNFVCNLFTISSNNEFLINSQYFLK